MTWDAIKANKTLRNYQWMFRIALVGTLFGLFVGPIGLVAWMMRAVTINVPAMALLVVSLGGLTMYRVTVSTMHLLEEDSIQNWSNGR
jgi:hypothetical protein